MEATATAFGSKIISVYCPTNRYVSGLRFSAILYNFPVLGYNILIIYVIYLYILILYFLQGLSVQRRLCQKIS